MSALATEASHGGATSPTAMLPVDFKNVLRLTPGFMALACLAASSV
jgi:hypothetical protein